MATVRLDVKSVLPGQTKVGIPTGKVGATNHWIEGVKLASSAIGGATALGGNEAAASQDETDRSDRTDTREDHRSKEVVGMVIKR